jgi:hypothetical protein
MWYKDLPSSKKEKPGPSIIDENNPNPDYHLAISLIGTMVRQNLFLKRKYNPTPMEVKHAVSKVVTHMVNKYGDIETMRNKTTSESLTPIIQAAIKETLNR